MNNILTTTISLLLIGESYGNVLHRLSRNSRKLLDYTPDVAATYRLDYIDELDADFRVYNAAGEEDKEQRNWLTPFSGRYKFFEIRNYKPAYIMDECFIPGMGMCNEGSILYATCLESKQLRWQFYRYDHLPDDPTVGQVTVLTCEEYAITPQDCQHWLSYPILSQPNIANSESGEYQTYETNEISPSEVEQHQECAVEGVHLTRRRMPIFKPWGDEINDAFSSDIVTIWYNNKFCVDFGEDPATNEKVDDFLTAFSGEYIFKEIVNNRPSYEMGECKDPNNCRTDALLQGSCVGPAGDESLHWQFIDRSIDNSMWGVWNMCKVYSTTPEECNNDNWVHRRPMIYQCGDHNSYETDKNYNQEDNNECAA